MRKVLFLFVMFLFLSNNILSQVENVPLHHPVYDFLKEMKVKQIIPSVGDDNPNLSRFEVRNMLLIIREKSAELSSTENKLVERYFLEFIEDELNAVIKTEDENGGKFLYNYENTFSGEPKYLYKYKKDGINLYAEIFGHLTLGQEVNNLERSAFLFDGGLRFRGTLFNHLGYFTDVIKGAATGSREFSAIVDPKILTSFKYVEDLEEYPNYEFMNGYLKYYAEPIEDMHISVQLGREKITYGYGYGSKLVLSGDNPNMDFIKMNFNYGILSFSSIHASTVGNFNEDRDLNYTKYFAANKVKLSFDGLFDIGAGETIVYSGRDLDLGYVNPFIFYKFVEMSIQDRDNGTFFFDFQSDFVKNLELQATFFLDENILFNMGELHRYINKTAYQVGAFWYEAFTIPDLSMVLEYTRIRPYVYTHTNYKNNYSSFGQNLGHRIGPNADEIFAKLSYNVNEWIRFNFEYQKIRSGKNIVDAEGNVIYNVGGDMFVPWRAEIDSDDATFLDGERINNDILTFDLRLEPVRDIYFDIIYKLNFENNLTYNTQLDSGYGFIRMTVEM